MLPRTTSLFRIRPAVRSSAPVVLVPLRALSASAVRPHKESQSHDTENDIAKLKEDSLQRQKQGKGEWMAGLASDSEESVKADQQWDASKAGIGSGGTSQSGAGTPGQAKKPKA